MRVSSSLPTPPRMLPTRKRSLPIAYIGGVLIVIADLCADRDGRGRTPELHGGGEGK